MPDKKKCTLMFYFASDNPLAPGIISQLKALKAAGFHKEANVIAQFDPYTAGTPTHIFDVNILKKLESTEEYSIGWDSEDPFIRNLVEDKLWRDEKDRTGELLIRDRVKEDMNAVLKERGLEYAPGVPRSGTVETNGNRYELGPLKSLEEFLRFCSSRYPAEHYMLFILGHGVAVGNDLFLFDEHAEENTLSLSGLRSVLENFTLDIKSHNGAFELISFHSCSVSSLEVSYELRKTAKYMLASQGATFVGSWPYREILLRIFKDLNTIKDTLTEDKLETMLNKIFSYCLHNSTDFLLAGYPFDLCLCNLKKMEEVKPPMDDLARQLIEGLEDPETKESILLSHLESQSFYGEMYTDIMDFCRCLYLRMKRAREQRMGKAGEAAAVSNGFGSSNNNGPGSIDPKLLETSLSERAVVNLNTGVATLEKSVAPDITSQTSAEPKDEIGALEKACAEVVKAIRATVVEQGFAGPEYQYARGLSIYFPWSRPSADSGILGNYRRYQIASKKKQTVEITRKQEGRGSAGSHEKIKYQALPPTWLDFLNRYFDDTRRAPTIYGEIPETGLGEEKREIKVLSEKEKLFEDQIAVVYSQAAPSMAPNAPGTLQKGDKTDPMGGDCACPTIKNYTRDTRPRRDRVRPIVEEEDSGFARSIFRKSP